MSKNAPAPEPVVEAAVEQQVTLTEFCMRLSEKIRGRPELISAFESSQRRAGNIKGPEEAFQARFDKFIKTPV